MKLKTLKYRELIAKLRRFGLEGPFYRGKHPYFLLGDRTIKIPNQHQNEVGKAILKDIIRQLEITAEEFWEL